MKFAVLAVFFVMQAFSQVVITDSGSTNRLGMTVTIGEEGEAAVANRRGDKAKMVIEKDMHARLMQDLEAAMPLDRISVHHCAKSVSFGSRMFLTYKGMQSPDLSCAGQTDPLVIALQKDAQEIMAVAKTKVPQNRLQFQ